MCNTETYSVEGMTCDHCARAVTAEVGAVDGVTNVEVDVTSGRVSVTTHQPVPVAQLREAIEEAGYTLAT